MLNPWLAITFQAVRLGFEAQNAMALRMMRLVGDVSKTAPGGMIADKAPPPADAQKAVKKVAARSGGRRRTVTKVHKKRVRAKRPRHSNNK
jgi:nitrous oxide reductase accessory protein NosL